MKMSYVTSNILIVCFGIKKCMLLTKKAIAPYSDPYMRIGSLYFKRKAISGLILKLVAGDANGHRTPNMPVNKKLQIVPFQKMI